MYDLNKMIDRQRAEKRFAELLEERTKIILTKKVRRTLSQNNYLYLILGWFACETGYTAVEAKQIFKEQSSNIFRYEKNGYDFMKSSAELTTTEMTHAIERFRNYSSAEAGIYLPEPREKEWLEEIESEMQRNKFI